MSEIKNGRLGLYGAEHSKCNHMMTLGFKGLSTQCLVAPFRRFDADYESDRQTDGRTGVPQYNMALVCNARI